MTLTKITKLIMLATISFILFSGCVSDEEKKEEMKLQFLEDLQQPTSYEVFGELTLQTNLSTLFDESNQPLTYQMMQFVEKSTTNWNGTVDLSENRLDTDFTIVNAASSTEQQRAHILLDDRALYFQLPILNEEQEYFSTYLNDASPLREQQKISTSLLLSWIESSPSEWYTFTEVSNEERTTTKMLIEVKDEKWAQFIASFQEQISTSMEQFKTDEAIADHPAVSLLDQAWMTEFSESMINISLLSPLQITLEWNEEGYVINEEVSLSFNHNNTEQLVNWKQTYSNINEIKLTEIKQPEQTTPWEKILLLLK
ncbi:hypothetical protein [Longirhabdus pacifica]|uniref:hypothetical protein n=1 Tax=Longirhabdus pacifica TaxID=2305227 RepID=UPI0010087237|nr:hypothetical protein [Longirhabdus pacifica]